MWINFRKMKKWNKEFEEEITLLIKDWLKQKGKTQKDLSKILKTNSDRMPVIIETLKTEFSLGGLPKLARVLCKIDEEWSKGNTQILNDQNDLDPFSQLDLLLEAINEDCNN